MIAPRRFLPSISALLSFEAVTRLGTATAAAQELNLTQSAVSRQIKTLEEQLGVSLMIRQGRRLTPTQAGLDYVTQVRDILNRLAQASVSARTNPTGGTLDLAILPALGTHWLAPRRRGPAANGRERCGFVPVFWPDEVVIADALGGL